MTKYEKFTDVNYFSKYRIDIIKGKYKGVYMYNEPCEERLFIANYAQLVENNTDIYFFERITNTIDGRAKYDIIDRITIKKL